jgi:hypothetical protein
MSEGGDAPAGPSYADRIAELAAVAEESATAVVPTPPWRPLEFESVQPKPIRKLEVTEDQAKSLAITRRRRISEFWGGAMIATIPGTWGTLSEMNTKNLVLPSNGHIAEVLICLVTATLFLASLLNFGEPTSIELLKELFPQTAKKLGFGARVGGWLGDVTANFNDAYKRQK